MYGKVLLRWFVVRECSVRCYSVGSSKKLLDILATMPKANTSRIADAQRQRQNINKKSEKYSASHVYLQVIGSGARGAPNTLYLFTDQKRYLFNCGECTQRLSHEHKVKLSRLNDIFITSKTWRNIGGLPGLSLTLQDVGVPNITLHGPEGLDELYNATKRFVIMKDMNVKMAKCSPTEDFEDSVLSVRYVLLGNDKLLSSHNVKTKKQRQEEKTYEEYLHDDTDYYKRQIKYLNSGRPHSSYDSPKKKTDKALTDLPYTSNCSVAFICTLKKRLGTLDLEKCVEKGVKPGPLLGQLKAGHDVVLPDGTVVHACDVKTPDDPGPVFIVLEVLDISCLKEIDFKMHFDNEENPKENVAAIVVHYTPPNVLNHPKYKKFMSMFGPSCQHLILNSQNVCLGSEAVHRTQHKLHLLDSDIFPLLKDVSLPAVWSAEPVLKTDSPVMMKGLEDLKNKIAIAQFQNIINMDQACKGDVSVDDGQTRLNVIAGHSLTMYQLRPKMELDRSLEPKLHVQDYIKETMDVDGFVASLANFRQMVDSIRYMKSDLQIEYPKVVFLGTGSCIPSKTRNVSALVIHINEDSSILLDCGEGTFGQLVRFYGPKKVNAFLRTLKGIYISHLHADHHIGLFGVVQARKQAMLEVQSCNPMEPLYVLAPGQIFGWLSTYDQQFEKIRSDITLIPNQDLLSGVHDKQHTALTPAMLSALGVHAIQMCLVSHCPNAFGVAIQIDDQYKITYSGDTIPCEELVRIGENSTVLIHEATMEDELELEARVKMHSTTSQAIDIGRQMNAQYTVLTHFSQRYARLPRLSQQILNDNKSVGIAFDNMQITMNDLELLPFMYAPLQLMFAEHCVEMELKAEQRARKRERKLSNPILSTVSRNGTRQMKYPVMRSISPFLKPASFYRETHASRLRQESRGIVVVSVVAGARSKSLPSKKAIVHNVNITENNLPTRNPSTTSSSINGGPTRKNSSVRCLNSTIDSRSKTITTYNSPPSERAKRNAILKPMAADRKEMNNEKTQEALSEKHLVKLVDKKDLAPKPKDIKPLLININNMKTKADKEIKPTKPTLGKEAKNLHQNKHKNENAKAPHSHKSLRQFLDERGLPNNNKSFQPVTIGRSNASSIRSFKPQLEDIKSSFYLINQERLCQLKNQQAKAQKEIINSKLKVEKPKPLNDHERKNLLLKSKQKFLSKSYWNDSKYERIEGLNWISWK